MTYDHWKTTEPDWLIDQGYKPRTTTMPAPDADHGTPTTPPTQAEVDAIHRELTEAPGAAMAGERRDLLRRAALMIARLERAWLAAKSK